MEVIMLQQLMILCYGTDNGTLVLVDLSTMAMEEKNFNQNNSGKSIAT